MTPILKNFSSPAAVLPPIYHLSAPSASRKPSLLLSLPLLREPLGIGIGPPGEPRGVWMATLVEDVVAAFVEIARAVEDVVEDAAAAAAADVEAAAAAAADAEAACDVCLVAC